METYSYLTFLTSTVDFLSLCQGFIARKKWLNIQHLWWGHHQTWNTAVKAVHSFSRGRVYLVTDLRASLCWTVNSEPVLQRESVFLKKKMPGLDEPAKKLCQFKGEWRAFLSANTEWDGLNSMRPWLCSVWFLLCAGINSFKGNVCQKVFLNTDRSTEHSTLWQIAESVWSSGLKIGLETPEFSFWLHPQLSAVTSSKSFELLWARFIAPVILFDRPNEEVYGPIYLNFPIRKQGQVLLVCNYYPRVLKCFKSVQHFDVSSPICWYVGYLHTKKF